MKIPLTPVRCLYRAVDLFAAKTGVISGDLRFTYTEFGERCERVAHGLRIRGVQAGDRVAYLSFNNHQLLEGYFGPQLISAVSVPLNVRLAVSELERILQQATPIVLFYETEFSPLIPQLRQSCPATKTYVSLDRRCPHADCEYEQFLSEGRLPRPDIFSFDEDATAEIFYTSGTTGEPKGVMLSHRSLYLHALSVSATTPQRDRTVELHAVPLFHANGWGRPQSVTHDGGTHVLVRRFRASEVVRLIKAEGVTNLSMVPTMAATLLQAPDAESAGFANLEEIHLGGAPTAPELAARLERTFGCRVTTGYGLTETAPVATTSRPKSTVRSKDDYDRVRRIVMAGWPVPGVSIRVVEENGDNVPQDGRTVGEILVQSDGVSDGYFGETDPTSALTNLRDGWLHTGDLGTWDEQMFIQITGRQKDIIISGGENIAAGEVEAAMLENPAIAECAVVAIHDEKWGEVQSPTWLLSREKH